MRVAFENVSVSLGRRQVLERVSLSVPDGGFVAVVGPNGSGKSTLLRTVYRALRPREGRVLLDGADLWRMSASDAAQRTGVLMQEQHTGFEFTVAETVTMGRTPHLRGFERITGADRTAVAEALDRTGLSGYADRQVGQLSGGERQRVLLARALAQQPRLLVLDEPTNHLDIRHQLDILELVRALGITVIAALHGLDLAATYADTVVVLHEGRVAADGPPADVLDQQLLAAVFGVSARVERDETGTARISARPLCVCPQRACHFSCRRAGRDTLSGTHAG